MIDKTAKIDKAASIGKGVSIGAHSVIGKGVVLGKNVKIGSHVVIEKDATVGEGTKVSNFVSLGTDPQDLKYNGEETKLIIGKNNIIREFSSLNRGTAGGGGVTYIGDNNFLMAYSHIAHDCQIGNEVIIANSVNLAGHVTIEDSVVIGGAVVIHQFSRIGKYAFIGGASAVPADVPPFMKAVGNRAELNGLNSVGLRRFGFSSEAVSELKKAYLMLFKSKRLFKDALQEVEDTMSGSVEVMYLVEFLKKSQRGFIKACKEKD